MSTYAENILIEYTKGDGNDTVYGFGTDDTLQISGGTYSTQKSGNDIIVTVGDGTIKLVNAAKLSNVNIAVEENVAKPVWTLNGTTATYGTENKILVMVTGVKSTAGLSVEGNVVTVSKASVNATNITVSEGYTLALGSDVTKSSTTPESWTLNGNVATYKAASTSVGYTVAGDGKSVLYSAVQTAPTLSTIKGIKTTSGISISDNFVNLKASMLNAEVTVSGEYGFNFAAGNYNKKIITGSKVAGNIISNGKNLSINTGAGNDSIKVTGNANSIMGGAGNDTIITSGTNTSIRGGAGADVFTFSGGGIINDYAEEDIIRFTKGAASVSTSGQNVIFTVGNNKVTVKGGKDKVITYYDTDGKHVYPQIVDISGSTIKLLEAYSKDSFNVADYGTYNTIDASTVTHDLSITANKNANRIIGSEKNDYIKGLAGKDTIFGGGGKDTILGGTGDDLLFGGEGADLFVYASGGNDVIGDYREEDKSLPIFLAGSRKMTTLSTPRSFS